MVEFALVAPLFFLLLFGIIQFGILFGGQSAVVGGVRNTARYATTWPIYDRPSALATCGTPGTASDLVWKQLNNELKILVPGYRGSQLTTAWRTDWFENPDETPLVTTDDTFYVRLTLTATYKHQLFVPLVGAVVDRFDGSADGKWALSAAESMRIENPPLTATASSVTCP